MNPLAMARAGYGFALLIAPGPLLRLAGGTGSSGERTMARVLGARHLVQAQATAGRPGRVGLYAGAVVDALHAASMFALAAVSSDHRSPAFVDGCVATSLCSAGLLAARSGGAGDLAGG